MSQQKVVIIGAGIGGLATAALLAKAGFDVTVLEKHATAGGRAGQLLRDGFRFDTGPSWYLMPEVFEHFYELLDEKVGDHLDLTRLTPAYKVFFEHQPPVIITSDIDRDAATFELIERGAGRSLRRYITKGDQIYRLSLDHFLYSNFASLKDFFKKPIIGNGLQMLQLAVTPIHTYVGQFVRDRRLKQILEYPMVFLGTSPFSAPAIYSLMSALDFKEGVFYPRHGMYTIIESLVNIGTTLGVKFRFDAPVNSIDAVSPVASGVTLDSGETIAADIVISNADLHFTETALLEKKWQTYPESYWQGKEASPSAILVYIGVSGHIPEFEHHNLLFVDSWKDNFNAIYRSKTAPEPASIYISKSSTTDPTAAPQGHENIFVLIPFPAGVSVDKTAQARLVDTYLAQIKVMTGVDLHSRAMTIETFGPDDFSARYSSWQSSMLGQSHKLTQSAFFRTPNKSKKLTNLYYVGGNTTPGIGLPMCLIGAELVYKRLAGDKRGGRVERIHQIGESA